MKSTVRTTIHPDGKVEVETETSVSKDAGGATPYPHPPSPSLAMDNVDDCNEHIHHRNQKASVAFPLPLVALLCGCHARLDLSFKRARVFMARPVRVSCQRCCVVCVLNTRAFLCERRALTTDTFCLCLSFLMLL
jgi:hypothetical protein